MLKKLQNIPPSEDINPAWQHINDDLDRYDYEDTIEICGTLETIGGGKISKKAPAN